VQKAKTPPSATIHRHNKRQILGALFHTHETINILIHKKSNTERNRDHPPQRWQEKLNNNFYIRSAVPCSDSFHSEMYFFLGSFQLDYCTV
jgi:hypothetical protein